jgi:hypothetical protein
MTTMRKIIKKYGNVFIVQFSPEERTIYKLEENDVIDLTITRVSKGELKPLKKKIPKRKKIKSKGGKK